MTTTFEQVQEMVEQDGKGAIDYRQEMRKLARRIEVSVESFTEAIDANDIEQVTLIVGDLASGLYTIQKALALTLGAIHKDNTTGWMIEFLQKKQVFVESARALYEMSDQIVTGELS